MPTIPVESLIVGKVTEADYYSADGRLLIGKGEIITQEHLELMRRRNIWEVYYYTTEEETTTSTEERRQETLEVVDRKEEAAIESSRLASQWGIKNGKEGFEQLLGERMFETLDRALKLEKVSDVPVGRSLKSEMRQRFIDHRPESYKKEMSLTYQNALDTLKCIVHKLIKGTKVEQDAIRSIVETFIEPFVNDKNVILSIASQKVDTDDPVFAHMINVSLISMNIAAAMNYNKEQVIQVGMGALLHDIGMLFISPSIRFKEGRLNEDEWYEVRKHPLLGIYILDKTTRLPDAVKYVTYQIHERENGVGYPKQRSGRLIHNFARIAQVADIFDAISSPRPYR
ncbi:MAG: HD domain-containing protein, partial [Chitinispirillaceae bacterium]|nr:HD domain-containing protein [Chitinispirillaceae bacterium]